MREDNYMYCMMLLLANDPLLRAERGCNLVDLQNGHLGPGVLRSDLQLFSQHLHR